MPPVMFQPIVVFRRITPAFFFPRETEAPVSDFVAPGTGNGEDSNQTPQDRCDRYQTHHATKSPSHWRLLSVHFSLFALGVGPSKSVKPHKDELTFSESLVSPLTP